MILLFPDPKSAETFCTELRRHVDPGAVVAFRRNVFVSEAVVESKKAEIEAARKRHGGGIGDAKVEKLIDVLFKVSEGGDSIKAGVSKLLEGGRDEPGTKPPPQ
jgi:hypothetical protein